MCFAGTVIFLLLNLSVTSKAYLFFFLSKEFCEFYSYNSSFLGNYKIQSIIMFVINLLFLKLVRIY